MNKPPFLLPAPPLWFQAELQNRLVLLLNHVLMQEPQAMDRLKRQQGKTVRASWGAVELWLCATPAGLVALASSANTPDLQLTVQQTSPLAVVNAWLAGSKPAVDIQGDVQLAADVAWLVDNVRWDIEEDLARVLGDVPAYTLMGWGRAWLQAMRGWLVQAGAQVAQRRPDASRAEKGAS